MRPDTDPSWLADTLTAATAAGASPGRCLFSARRAQLPPPDPFEGLWWAGETLRDYRSDSHIAAVAVAGVGPVEMSILTVFALGGQLGRYAATRGWSPAAGRDAHTSIERETDRLDAPVIAAVGGDFPGVLADLETWGGDCIDAGTLPRDLFKRGRLAGRRRRTGQTTQKNIAVRQSEL